MNLSPTPHLASGEHGAEPPLCSGALPLVGHTATFLRDPESLILRGYAEHGRVFSLQLGGKKSVVMLGRENSRLFFAETDRKLSIRTAYPFFIRMFDPDFFFFADADEYRQQRELLLPRFRSGQFDEYIALMEEETRKLMDQLGHRGECDLIGTLGPLVMHIAARTFLGPDFSQRITGFFERFRDFSAGMDPVMPGWLPLPSLLRSRIARDRLRASMRTLIQDRRQNPIEPPDFLQILSQARFSDGGEVSDQVLVNMLLLLAWAGHETTTGHLAWALIDLVQHPRELDRVLIEQREVLREDSGLSMQALGRLAHLNRALHETERLHPVAFIMARQVVTPFVVDGYRLPHGALVLASPGISHRLPDEYPDPHVYRPDRYLDDARGMTDLIGFGGGLHRCLGVHFAYAEMKVVSTLLLRHYDFELVDAPAPVRGAKTKWPQSPCRIRYRAKRVHSFRASANVNRRQPAASAQPAAALPGPV